MPNPPTPPSLHSTHTHPLPKRDTGHKVAVVPQYWSVFSPVQDLAYHKSRISHQELLGHRSTIFISWPSLSQALPEATVTKRPQWRLLCWQFIQWIFPRREILKLKKLKKKKKKAFLLSLRQILDYILEAVNIGNSLPHWFCDLLTHDFLEIAINT